MIGGDVESGERRPIVEVADFRDVPEVADELHAIQVVHGDPSVRSPSRKGKQQCFPHGKNGKDGGEWCKGT